MHPLCQENLENLYRFDGSLFARGINFFLSSHKKTVPISNNIQFNFNVYIYLINFLWAITIKWKHITKITISGIHNMLISLTKKMVNPWLTESDV